MSCKLWWKFDDVTPCARTTYLEGYYPLAVGAALFAVLFTKSASYIYRHKNDKSTASPQDFKSNTDESQPLLNSANAYGATEASEEFSKDNKTKFSAAERHFDLRNISHTKEDGSPHGRIEYVYKKVDDRIRLGLEFLAVSASLALAISAYFIPELKSHYAKWPLLTNHPWFTAPLTHVALWTYVLFITVVRILNVDKLRIRLPLLFNHATFTYFFNIFPASINFRSALIQLGNQTLSYYFIIQFILAFVLFYLNFLSHIGDKPAELYYTSSDVRPSPEYMTSLFQSLSYSWIDLMVWNAYKHGLQMKDIWGLRKDDYALEILQSFEKSKKIASFTIQLFGHFNWLLAVQAFWAIIQLLLTFIPTVLLKKILEYVESPESSSKNLAWCIIIAMPLFKLCDLITSGISLFIGRRVCLRMRAIIIGEVYAKALRRRITISEVETEEEINEHKKSDSDAKSESSETKKTAELGAIINLMAIDAFKVSEICGYLHFFVVSVLMLVICITLLYRLLGWSALAGASSLIVLFPLNYKLATYLAKMQKDMLSITDKRIQKLNETIQSIRIIKFFAWEDQFFESIMKIRKDELHKLLLRLASWAASALIWFLTPTIITLLAFYCYTIVEGNTLTAPVAFTALSLFTLLRTPLDQLSDMTSIVLQSKVSLDRIDDFLHEEESTKYEQLSAPKGLNSPDVGFENATFSWNLKLDSDFKLRDLNISFKNGKLNVVIGATGSGKTSLLLALLGEMELNAGRVYLPGSTPRDELVVDPETGFTDSVAYCAQAAWLLNDTIRSNIVFSSPFHQERYDKVVEACGLARDFEILSAGDKTEIGEKGITLSGGQKQRVSLARALYSNSKTLLLDDCLSAVDSHTAAWIYENCISGPLMEGRTCILVSHNVALTVQNAEWIIVMENGRVKNQGTPEKLIETGDLGDDDMVKASVINSRSQSLTNLKDLSNKNEDLKSKSKIIEAKLQKVRDAEVAAAGEDGAAKQDKANEINNTGKLVEEESKSDGQVSFDVYKLYIKALGGWGTWLFIFVIFTVAQVVYMLQLLWLRKWASESGSDVNTASVASITMAQSNNVYDGTQFASPLPIFRFFKGGLTFFSNPIQQASENFRAMASLPDDKKASTKYFLTVYGVIGVVYAILAFIRILVVFWIGIRASHKIFKDVLVRVLNAKLRFFDKTPLGRIMNRFSKDIEGVDQELVPFAEGVFACLVQCISTLVLISLITPGFLFFAILISGLYFLVGMFYVNVSRELKRYESITKSPIHQHFSESLNGVATIRAYGVETRFMKQNLLAIDENNRPFFYLWVANRWLSFRNDFVGALVMLFAGIFVMLSIGKIDAGLAGLSLSYAIAFSENALWIVRLYANVEMNMNSVERLNEYLEIEQEPAAEIPETEPRSSWPEKGAISVKDLSLRYAPDLPRVIKNVTFDVEPCHKIGIVGRTGAGKSTIITAFFRFIDPETGSIRIDDIDITTIGLRNLRRAITIIPQDPTLFTGTIRSNLDPFSQYSDDQIFESLRRVNLIGSNEVTSGEPLSSEDQALDENQNKFLNLDTTVTEGGGNLSQGQRQLMCLARSLLKSPKVILLDEATASIDYKSDAMIQQTIREEFSNSTILTIAHRLRSIIDYDKILVMDAGTVVEYDSPYKLITEKLSLFYSMCDNSGELDTLIKLAKEAFIAKKNVGLNKN